MMKEGKKRKEGGNERKIKRVLSRLWFLRSGLPIVCPGQTTDEVSIRTAE